MQAIDPYVDKMMGSQCDLVLKKSLNQVENLLKIKCSEKPSNTDDMIKSFKENTGIELEFDYPREENIIKDIKVTSKGKVNTLEQNVTFDFITELFEDSKDKLYKKGIKTDSEGKFVELCFITAQIGQKYEELMEKISEHTGFRVGEVTALDVVDIVAHGLQDCCADIGIATQEAG